MSRVFYATGRAAQSRLLLDGARRLRDSDTSQFPAGDHWVEVVSSFRDGAVRVRGPGGREAQIPGGRGRRAPPAGTRVKIRVEYSGDYETWRASDGTFLAVDGMLVLVSGTQWEVEAWTKKQMLAAAQPCVRML